MEMTNSVNGVPIRLTGERWLHIVEGHCELVGSYHEVLEVIAKPDLVIEGYEGELLALKRKGAQRHLIVAYKEIDKNDGFVIMAFFSSRIKKLIRRKIIWKQEER